MSGSARKSSSWAEAIRLRLWCNRVWSGGREHGFGSAVHGWGQPGSGGQAQQLFTLPVSWVDVHVEWEGEAPLHDVVIEVGQSGFDAHAHAEEVLELHDAGELGGEQQPVRAFQRGAGQRLVVGQDPLVCLDAAGQDVAGEVGGLAGARECGDGAQVGVAHVEDGRSEGGQSDVAAHDFVGALAVEDGAHAEVVHGAVVGQDGDMARILAQGREVDHGVDVVQGDLRGLQVHVVVDAFAQVSGQQPAVAQVRVVHLGGRVAAGAGVGDGDRGRRGG